MPVAEFAYNNSYHAYIDMAPYEALYSKRCQSPLWWHKPGKASLLGADLVRQTTEQVKKIRNKILATQNRKKSYADNKRKPLEFQKWDHISLRFTPTTGIGKATKIKKLGPRFIGPFEILKRIGPVTYQIGWPPNLPNFHDVFHVSQLWKYILDPSNLLTPKSAQLKEDLTFHILPIRIVDRSAK